MPDKSSKDLIEEKMALVYDYNQASSLFIRAADRELQKSNPQKALEILLQGIKNHPKYPTAYILLGKTHLELSNYELAEEAFKKGCSLISSESSLSYYLSELEKKKSSHPGITQSRRIPFFDSGITEYSEDKPQGSGTSENPAAEAKPNNMLSLDDRLDDVAKEISSVKIIVPSGENEQAVSSEEFAENKKTTDNTLIVSETLAKIYVSQGKFKEAVEVYKKLQIKSPDKKDFYQIKIEEIQKQLGDLERK
ncbi:MAG: tetratricopeptide repeat protein [Bacillota bacterium]